MEQSQNVPWKGYCLLTCGWNSKFDIKKKIVCKNPHIQGYRQFDPVWRLYKFLSLKKYKKNKDMDSEIGWTCSEKLAEKDEEEADDDDEVESDEDYEDPDEMDEDEI